MCLTSNHQRARVPQQLEKRKNQLPLREAAERSPYFDSESADRPGVDGLFFDYSSLARSTNLDKKLKANRSYKAFKHDALIGPIFEVEEVFEGEVPLSKDISSHRSKQLRREPQSSILAAGNKRFFVPHHKKNSGSSGEDGFWSNPQLSVHQAEDSLSLRPHQKLSKETTDGNPQSKIRDFSQYCAREVASIGSVTKHRRNPANSREELRLKPSHSQPTLSFMQPTSSRQLPQDLKPIADPQADPIAVFSTSPEKKMVNPSRRAIRFEEYQAESSSMFQKKVPIKVIELPEEDEVSKAVIEDSGHSVSKDAMLRLPTPEGTRMSNTIQLPSDGGPSNSNQSVVDVVTPKFNKGRDINVSFGTRKGSEFQVSLIQMDRGDGCGQDSAANESSCLNINIQTPSAIKNLSINNYPNFPSKQPHTSRKNTPRLLKEL